MNQHFAGASHQHPILRIVSLRRTSQSQPTAWEGFTDTGNPVLISYRYGELRINISERSSQPGWITWRTVLLVRPALMIREINIGNQGGLAGRQGKTLEALRQEIRAEVESAILQEIRAANWNGSARRARVVTLGELSRWLRLYNDNLTRLRQLDITACNHRVELDVLVEGSPPPG